MPKRIQRRMVKNWRAPLDDQGRPPVYVGRNAHGTGKWGNPHRVIQNDEGWWVRSDVFDTGIFPTGAAAAAFAVAQFRRMVEADPEFVAAVRSELAGRDLMCWCPITDTDGNEVPCHATVLLDLAAGGDGRG